MNIGELDTNGTLLRHFVTQGGVELPLGTGDGARDVRRPRR
jgi:hypothetical protein